MYKALAYKEWLKVRWFILAAMGLEIIALIYIFSNLRATIEFNSAVNIWNYVVFRNFMFFEPIKYIPLFIGILIGVAQYLPELSEMKLKLTLHLPLKENNVFVFLNLFGTSLLLMLFIPVIVILLLGSSAVFPREIINATILTITPWFLSSFIAYYFISAIMVEPLWNRRVLILLVGFVWTQQLLLDTGFGEYKLIIFSLFILVALFSYINLLSGLRFKRGAKW